MSLQKLDIYNVRNIRHASLNPSPKLNFIYGNNASGKSSLLEAVFILGRARSFRTPHIKQVINFNQNELIVSGKSLQKNGNSFQLGVQADDKEVQIRINQKDFQSRHDLAYALPIQLIDPKSYLLLDSGPQMRREFIDWGVFNDNESFLAVWRQFKKTLKQRNALLKTKKISDIEVWNKELVNYGTIVADLRLQYIKCLEPVFNAITEEFLSFETLTLNLLSGWHVSKGFKQSLADDLEKDIRYGFTHSGPHRCDFQVCIDARLAKDYVSRGQLKLLVLGLKLAQVKLLQRDQGSVGCLLIDDFTAELDLIQREKLLQLLSNLDFQVFMTATESQEFGDIGKHLNHKVFHMKHGQVKQL
ncbi:MAG: DNA replication/repair protein RecF [Gammaproteobacteria bacterium HGW-Gammaproteobacteria-3]|nr:MAG: DNA replication/repair protein RecF [Gammaproteobacteria bacterium HGW-Gammaproteobacteria-3]